MKTVQLSGLNVYDPTDEQLLLLVKAEAVRWMGRGKGKFYRKVRIYGPYFRGEDNNTVYRVELEGEIEAPGPIIPIIN